MRNERRLADKIYVLVLNWNGWADTIECLESVFRSRWANFQVIVCDNASSDGSLDHIKAWADGRLDVFSWPDNPLRDFSYPPISKPVSYVEYDRQQAEAGGVPAHSSSQLILVQTGANLGFAGGNNVGLRYALARGDFAYLWLLNNDTVTPPNTLPLMIAKMHRQPDVGMCGSTLLYYHKPDTIQAAGGGVFNKWLGTTHSIAGLMPVTHNVDEHSVTARMSYVSAASMLVSRNFIRQVGLMCEDYFLYFEELDWAVRATGQFSMAFAPKAVVYHKEGASIGSSSDPKKKSALSDYFGIRNRLLFARKYYPYTLPTVYLGLFAAIWNRIRRKQLSRTWMILGIAFGRWRRDYIPPIFRR